MAGRAVVVAKEVFNHAKGSTFTVWKRINDEEQLFWCKFSYVKNRLYSVINFNHVNWHILNRAIFSPNVRWWAIIAIWGWFSHDVLPVTCCEHGPPGIATVHFYASAFRRRRHYVFGLSVRPSVRPSVRSLKYPILTCTWVHWSTRPTVTVLRHVRPSVRLSVPPSVRRGFRAFAGERMEGLARNFTCWCILIIFRTD